MTPPQTLDGPIAARSWAGIELALGPDMASPGAYFRPGLSVVTLARQTQISHSDLEQFLAATVPHVEQVCMAVDSSELLEVALKAGPKVRIQVIPAATPEGEAWKTSAQLADHDWSFHLLADELLQPSDFVHLHHVLPYAGARTIVLVDDQGQEVQFRGWRTGWNMAPNGDGQLVPAGPSASSPRGIVALQQLPHPEAMQGLPARQTPTPQRGPVLICGMHRSGTSMTARLASLLGVQLGHHLVGVHTPAIDTNPTGHWEDITTLAIHRRMLRHVTGVNTPWEWVLSYSLHTQPIQDEYIIELAQSTQEKEDLGRWGIKDPRLSLLLPIWRQIATTSCVVAVVRDPLAVAESMTNAYCVPFVDGLRMWAAYNQHLLEGTAGEGDRLLVVHYDVLMQDLQPQLARMAQYLGVAEPSAELLAECERFVRQDLRHQTVQPGELRDRLRTALGEHEVQGEVEQIARIYEHMCNLAMLNVRQSDMEALPTQRDEHQPLTRSSITGVHGEAENAVAEQRVRSGTGRR